MVVRLWERESCKKQYLKKKCITYIHKEYYNQTVNVIF